MKTMKTLKTIGAGIIIIAVLIIAFVAALFAADLLIGYGMYFGLSKSTSQTIVVILFILWNVIITNSLNNKTNMKTKKEIEKMATNKYGTSIYSIDEVEAYKEGYTQCQEDMTNNVKVTRFEVIDESGRLCTRHNCKVELSYQDDGRTLKVFLNEQS
jgi:hypothetical protein